MAGEYEKAITIEEAIGNIVSRKYLLPAIQRKFVWSTTQICVLFDSIMRQYPINTFMLWTVKDQAIKNNFRFYQFLENYCERFSENNPDFDTTGHGEFSAVIDGQQRLTSLYIGLKGTYATKLSRKRWPVTWDVEILPPKKLYLNLKNALDEETNDEMMVYEFKFLTDAEYNSSKEKSEDIWFKVGDILNFDKAEAPANVLSIIMRYLATIGQSENEYALNTLILLYFVLRIDKVIHYYNETNQNIDHVLDIFLRTNHGGTPLSFSDLLMSIAIANWKQDARQQIDDIVDQIRLDSHMGFSIDRNFVLKAALMLTDSDVKFQVRNFTGDQVGKIEQNWEEIKGCLLATFRLIQSFGLNDSSLRAKNAAIPIAYYLYNQGRNEETGRPGLYADINTQARHDENRKKIRQWLHMSLLKKVFGGQSDGLLTDLRHQIKKQIEAGGQEFPLNAIVEHFRGKSKNLAFDDDFIDGLLRVQKNHGECFSILALLFPDLDYTRSLDMDHLHPASGFRSDKLRQLMLEISDEELWFYLNPAQWNSIVNLHLLDSSKNKSKQDTSLQKWYDEQNGMSLEQLLIPDGTSLDLKDFKSFIDNRREYIKIKLKSLIHHE